MEDEDDVQFTQEIDFCTMGMFIIGKKETLSYMYFFICCLTVFSPLPSHAKPCAICTRFYIVIQAPS